jgi:hypothetical protein
MVGDEFAEQVIVGDQQVPDRSSPKILWLIYLAQGILGK